VPDEPKMLNVEFLAEIVRAPGPGDATARFRYIQNAAVEVAVSVEWWDALGQPEYVQVRVAPDDQELDRGRYHESEA
jgi:hypothetical protein